MARKTFFSFHYKKDNWRASIVRNSWVTQDSAGFFDSADWEAVKKKDDSSIEKWIDNQLSGTSVTVILIGSDTYGRKWINYEITSSWKKGNGLLGIYIHNIKDKDEKTSTKGLNPFTQWKFTLSGEEVSIPTYDWIKDDGYNNLGKWIEDAAKRRGR
ncbi:hypothetical protein EHQ64_09180 [Leptospira sarikeiensis]|uniref:Thoeris protein ThsB TIR-like domain-containing protein n=1 Tax=Leptospira sarikeiensis TaxID=2484943 RepID=A0A4R9K8N7_9LEPT|nr:hypothetical protein EHQ64_09180 [Leptospira sarikeiensis]